MALDLFCGASGTEAAKARWGSAGRGPHGGAVMKLMINKIPLDCRKFRWGLVAGSQSPEYSFICFTEIADRIWQSGLGATLEIEVTGWTGNQRIDFKPTFSDLWLWQRRQVSASETQLTLRDRRAFWERQRVTLEINRIRNVSSQRVPAGAKGVRRDFQRIAAFRYFPRSLHLRGELDPAPATTPIGDPRLRAYTALEAVRRILSLCDPPPDDVRVEAEDIGYIHEDGVHVEDLIPDLLSLYLRYARANLYMDGSTAVLFSLDDYPPIANLGGYDKGGWPALADYRMIRPSKVRVRVPIEWEARVDFVETESGAKTYAAEEIYFENVIRNPNRVPDPWGSGDIEVGEWITIDHALAAWAADTEHPWPARRPLTLSNWRKDMLTSGVFELYCIYADNPSLLDPVRVARIQALSTHYRRTFRICETWLSSIFSWRPVRVKLEDARTQYRSPSPVWMDYTLIPMLIPSEVKNGAAPTVQKIRAWPEGEKQFLLDDAQVCTDAILEIVRPDAFGIVRLRVLPDLEGHRAKIVPGIVLGAPNYDLFALTGNVIWDDEADGEPPRLDPDWRMATLLSLTLATPNGSVRHRTLVRKAAKFARGMESIGAPLDSFRPQEPLRVRWDDASSRTIVDSDGLRIEGGEEINAEIIEEVADSVAEQVYFAMRDRIIGEFRTPYWIPDICRPRGNISAVLVELDGDKGSAETIFVVPAPPPARDAWELLPREAKKILYPRLEAGGQA